MQPDTTKTATYPASSLAEHISVSHRALICNHCGERRPIELPIALNLFFRIAGGFNREHRECPHAAEEFTPFFQIQTKEQFEQTVTAIKHNPFVLSELRDQLLKCNRAASNSNQYTHPLLEAGTGFKWVFVALDSVARQLGYVKLNSGDGGYRKPPRTAPQS